MVDLGDSQAMEVIIPAAGASSRFPNMRPKYLLAAYDGRLMIEHAIGQHLGKHHITVGVLAEHDREYHVHETFGDVFGTSVDLVVLDRPTAGPADTVRQVMLAGDIDPRSGLLVKDCDSFYQCDPTTTGNAIHVDTLRANPDLRMAANKSYVRLNDQMVVTDIIEKTIISEWFCVGGYQFARASEFADSCEAMLERSRRELYVSDVISYMLGNGTEFIASQVRDWCDVGTAEDWYRFNDRPTLFIDIDGTMVINQGQWGNNTYRDPATAIPGNVACMLRAQAHGCQLVFTTARSGRFEAETRHTLDQLGFANYRLLMDLHHSYRMVINDYAPTNPHPSAVAINLPRNQDLLTAQLPRHAAWTRSATGDQT